MKSNFFHRDAAFRLIAWSLLIAGYAHGQGFEFDFDSGGYLVALREETNSPPVVLGHPQPQVVEPGELASFFVVAADTRGLAYQWRFNGTNLLNATNDALLNCARGGTTARTGYGQLQISTAITLNGALSVDLLPGFTPATNDTSTVVTAGTRNNTFARFSYPSNRVTMTLSNSPASVILCVTDVFPVPQPVLLTPQLAGSNVLLTWTATSNVTYRLENNADLGSTNWTAIPGDVTTPSNTASKLRCADDEQPPVSRPRAPVTCEGIFCRSDRANV